MNTTFIHTADWQLGKPYHRVADVAKRSRIQNERFECLKRIGAAVKEHDASFVLIAGDLFDSSTPLDATVAKACEAIGAMEVLVVGWARAGETDRKAAHSGSSKNSLEDQMIGYWAINMEDKAMVKMMDEIAGMLASLPGGGGTDPDEAKVAARKEVAEVLGVSTLEFKKGEVIIHGPDGLQKNVYTIKSQDAGTGALELEVTKWDDAGKQPGKAVLKGDQLTFTTGAGEDMQSMVLKRIDAAEFKRRQEAAGKIEADDGED